MRMVVFFIFDLLEIKSRASGMLGKALPRIHHSHLCTSYFEKVVQASLDLTLCSPGRP